MLNKNKKVSSISLFPSNSNYITILIMAILKLFCRKNIAWDPMSKPPKSNIINTFKKINWE